MRINTMSLARKAMAKFCITSFFCLIAFAASTAAAVIPVNQGESIEFTSIIDRIKPQ
jgi:CHASE3 domain sensor protein